MYGVYEQKRARCWYRLKALCQTGALAVRFARALEEQAAPDTAPAVVIVRNTHAHELLQHFTRGMTCIEMFSPRSWWADELVREVDAA